MDMKFSGTFEELKEKLNKIEGKWNETQPNKKVFQYKNGILNWFETTGTINFQGKGEGKNYLEVEAPKLLGIINPDQKQKDTSSKSIKLTKGQDKKTSLEKGLYSHLGLENSELVIGIVSAVGTDSNDVIEKLESFLTSYSYQVKIIRVSELLNKYTGNEHDEYERISHYMEEGNKLRQKNDNAILAAGIIKKIVDSRDNGKNSNSKIAYIINSLKHPNEVNFLRQVYANGFYLIGIHAEEIRRRRYLIEKKDCKATNADELIKIDEDELVPFGQKTRDTYHLADFFLDLGADEEKTTNSLKRFLDLMFSHPYHTSSFDEFAMFMAFNTATRSGDLSRQVGAVITRHKQILATGTNEVPKFGGGQYWAEYTDETKNISDKPDGKDYTREEDPNKRIKTEIINEIVDLLKRDNIIEDEEQVKNTLERSPISDLTEFGRVVHAEMEAILSCGRAGISTVDATLYCTTFPCHNCAKHIVASGVKRVVYVEPYPKSRALDLHSDSIILKTTFDENKNKSNENKRVVFEPFIGVGPRRFLDLFSLDLGAGKKLKRKNNAGKILEWDKAIRTPLTNQSYLDVEQKVKKLWEDKNDE